MGEHHLQRRRRHRAPLAMVLDEFPRLVRIARLELAAGDERAIDVVAIGIRPVDDRIPDLVGDVRMPDVLVVLVQPADRGRQVDRAAGEDEPGMRRLHRVERTAAEMRLEIGLRRLVLRLRLGVGAALAEFQDQIVVDEGSDGVRPVAPDEIEHGGARRPLQQPARRERAGFLGRVVAGSHLRRSSLRAAEGELRRPPLCRTGLTDLRQDIDRDARIAKASRPPPVTKPPLRPTLASSRIARGKPEIAASFAAG